MLNGNKYSHSGNQCRNDKDSYDICIKLYNENNRDKINFTDT